jgi:5-methyltetrahydrofolate--homocysteine methyltransferase
MRTLRQLLGPDLRVADGGVGTGLQAGSLEAGQAPEELALDSPDELVQLHLAFIDAGSDIVLTDTFGANAIRLQHARVVSFSFDAGVGEPRTMMGHSVEDVLLAMAALGADGIGFNCGASLGTARATAQEFVAKLNEHDLDLPLWVKPNAGIPEPMSGRYPAEPVDMAAFAAWAAELGAAVVGGCCGTTGAHLHEISSTLR